MERRVWSKSNSAIYSTPIDEFAANDMHRYDAQYNKGLDMIRQYGYKIASVFSEVKYYVECNNL